MRVKLVIEYEVSKGQENVANHQLRDFLRRIKLKREFAYGKFVCVTISQNEGHKLFHRQEESNSIITSSDSPAT